MKQKVIRVGTSAGVTLSKEALAVLGLKIGDRIDVRLDDKTQTVSLTSAGEKNRARRITDLTLTFIEKYRDDLNALKDR